MKVLIIALIVLCCGVANSNAQVTWTEINHAYFLDNRVVNALMFDDHGTFYAGSWSGLHISKDKGLTWSAVDYFNQIDVSGLTQNSKGYLYAAGWRQSGSPSGVEGVWRSKDHGASWEIVTAKDWASIRSYGIVCLSDQSLVVATDDGLLRSTDDGDSWTLSNGRFHPQAPYSIQDVNAIYRAPNSADRAHDVLFAQFGGPVFGRSTNGGTVWSYILDSINAQAVMSVDSDGRVFVPGDSGIYRSTDYGTSWQFIRLDPGLQIYSLSLAVSNGWIFGLGTRPILSTDHGDTWKYARSGLTWEYNASAAIESPDHYVYFVQPTGALWRTKEPLGTNGVALSRTAESIDIYPNPADEVLYVRSGTDIKTIEMYDVTGRCIVRRQISNSDPISLQGVRPGAYLLRATSASGSSTTRAVCVR